MPITRLLAQTLAAAALLAAAPAAADSIRCARGIVSTGDTKLDLLGKCGPATLVSAREVQATAVRAAGRGTRLLAGTAAAQETWTYDLGPSQLVRRVVLERGRVVRVETAGHGFATPPEPPPIRAARCDPDTVDEGDLQLELLATCGEPTLRDAWEERRGVVSDGDGAAVLVTVPVELWIYDLGPSRFIRLFRIEDGRVTAVDTGGYGYGR